MSHLWGIDLGGTKIEGVVLDPSLPEPTIGRLRHPTESVHGYRHIVSQIGRVLGDLTAKTGESLPPVIGIGTPGVLDPKTQRMKNSNTLCLNDQPLKEDLEAEFGCRFEMANDANCFALAEATLGAAKGYKSVFGIILATGVGGGVEVHEHVLYGHHGIAGEWGHNVLDPDGPPCYCGKRGCVETILAGPSLQRFYESQSGVARTLPEIVARAGAGTDPAAQATMQRLQGYFGKALSTIINALDPEAIVLGGGVGNIELLYSAATRAEVSKYVFNPSFDTPVLKPTLGDSAGVFGAAMLASA